MSAQLSTHSTAVLRDRLSILGGLASAIVIWMLPSWAQAQAAEAAEAANNVATTEALDTLWVVIAAAMVFFMQAGFLAVEVGFVRPRNIAMVAMKNLVDWVAVSMAFMLVGFGLMFGTSLGGMLGGAGGDLLMAAGIDRFGMRGFTFFMFQLAFCGTAATVVSGAMSERTGFVPYLFTSFVVGLIIYPLFGHWAWGNLLVEDNQPLLVRVGFHDFAGSTVVHSLGGWVGLMGAWLVGPRIGRLDADGNVRAMRGYSVPFAVLGTIILWFGWWGFNGGSTLALNDQVGPIITNTNLSAAAGGFVAFAHCWFVQGKADLNEKFIGGILGGLVSITACCDVLDPSRSLLVGGLAGVLHNYGYDFILKRAKIDDPVGAIPIHLICGIFGTLCVAMGDSSKLGGRAWQEILIVQCFGVLACMVWTIGCSLVLFVGLKTTIGLRVSPEEEVAGLNIEGEFMQPEEQGDQLEVDMDMLDSLMND